MDAGIERVLATLRGLLTAGESLEAWALQSRLFAFTHRRLCIAATSGRFIWLKRGLFGGYDSGNIRWQDLKETRIHAGIFAADLSLIAQASSDLSLGSESDRIFTFEGLDKQQAQAMYRICQLNDQVWREKRRVRDLEELRAKSGGVQFGSPFGSPYGTPPGHPGGADADAAHGAESEPTRRLRQAREMLDAKLISDAEFESIKAKIVSGL
jgi:hypothetical protein